MAAKKDNRGTRSTKADAYTMVLEDLRSQFLVFGEALQGLRDHMDARFEHVDARFGTVDHELGLVKRDLELVKHDVVMVKSDVAELKSDVGVLRGDVELLKVAVIDNAREIRQLRKAL